MKKVAIAIATLGLSSTAFAGQLDYNHVTGSLSVNSADNRDSDIIFGAAANMRQDSGLFFGGSVSNFFAETASGSSNDHFTLAAEVGFAHTLSEQHEVAGGIGISYVDLYDANSDYADYTPRLQYTYSCSEGRQYEVEYNYNIAEDANRADTDALRFSVEGGNRNGYRYDLGFTRALETEVNALDASVIFPLAPQDQGEIVIGLGYSTADNTNVSSYDFNLGYRWNLD